MTVLALLRARSDWSGKTNVCHFRHPRIMARKPLKVSTDEMCNTGDPPLVCARTLIHVSTTLYAEHSASPCAHIEQSGGAARRACRGRPGHRCAQSANGQVSVLCVTSSFCSSFRANPHWSAQAAECHKRDRSDSGVVRPNAELSRCFCAAEQRWFHTLQNRLRKSNRLERRVRELAGGFWRITAPSTLVHPAWLHTAREKRQHSKGPARLAG